MSLPLPPFVAKLIASDEYEEKKYFETKAAAEKWVLGEGKAKFDGDIERAEIHHVSDGLIWSRDRLKIEDDIRYRQMRNPDSLLWHNGLPRPKSKPSVSSYCPTCAEQTMFWPEREKWYGLVFRDSKRLLRCSQCYKVVPDNAPSS
jgi:hypothetical protein